MSPASSSAWVKGLLCEPGRRSTVTDGERVARRRARPATTAARRRRRARRSGPAGTDSAAPPARVGRRSPSAAGSAAGAGPGAPPAARRARAGSPAGRRRRSQGQEVQPALGRRHGRPGQHDPVEPADVLHQQRRPQRGLGAGGVAQEDQPLPGRPGQHRLSGGGGDARHRGCGDVAGRRSCPGTSSRVARRPRRPSASSRGRGTEQAQPGDDQDVRLPTRVERGARARATHRWLVLSSPHSPRAAAASRSSGPVCQHRGGHRPADRPFVRPELTCSGPAGVMAIP